MQYAHVLGKKEILRAITNQTDDTVFQSQYSETQINFVWWIEFEAAKTSNYMGHDERLVACLMKHDNR